MRTYLVQAITCIALLSSGASGLRGAAKPVDPRAPRNSDGKVFVHPGISYTQGDLDRMKAMVDAGVQPWKRCFDALAGSRWAGHGVKAPWRGTNSVPCWSWRGSEGNRTVVEVYTQAPVAKLYLNGRHVGTKRVRDCHADFSVSYEAGELIALACSSDGRALGRTTLASADGTLGLRLSLERHDGNIAFVRVDAADAAGVVEGSRFDEVTVSVTGGELIAFGSAAQKSELSYLGGTFPRRYGRGLAVVRVGAGCTVSAWAEGLGAATLKL